MIRSKYPQIDALDLSERNVIERHRDLPEEPATTLTLEEGKYYRTRGGDKVGPMWRVPGCQSALWTGELEGVERTLLFTSDGRQVRQMFDGRGGAPSWFHPASFDLVTEWDDTANPAVRDLKGYGLTWRAVTELRRDLPKEPADTSAQQKDEPAWKQDAGKARIDLIAPEFITATADVLAFGAAKYDERNWEKGMSWGRCFGAMMRHLWAWWGGEKIDPESGLPHLAHAACCLMFLIAYEQRQIGTDDRKLTVDK